MKLAALGVVAAVIGAALGVQGLVGIGAFWAVVGPVMRQHGKRLIAATEASPDGKPPVDARTFAYGTFLWAFLAVPSLLVGILQIGIDDDHIGWRWLPIAVGALALGVGGLAAVLYVTGSAVSAVGDRLPTPTVPATLRIRSVRETGTFVNERPRLEFVFAVEPDAGTGVPSYEVTKKATTPFTAMAYLRIGEGFRATVAGPDEPTSMDIRWDEPVPVQTPPADPLPS